MHMHVLLVLNSSQNMTGSVEMSAQAHPPCAGWRHITESVSLAPCPGVQVGGSHRGSIPGNRHLQTETGQLQSGSALLTSNTHFVYNQTD